MKRWKEGTKGSKEGMTVGRREGAKERGGGGGSSELRPAARTAPGGAARRWGRRSARPAPRGCAAVEPRAVQNMKVKVISVLEDNYMYLVIEESTRDAVAVDAAVPKRVRGAGAARYAGRRYRFCSRVPRSRSAVSFLSGL